MADSQPARILVVDDDRIIVEILRQSLSLAGYQVAAAADGEQGLTLAREQRPDLILLDVMMPKLDGYSVCRQLKGDPDTQLIPIIILTALTDRDDKLQALEVGADEFIRKPPDRQELLIRIKSLLKTKRLYDQIQNSHRTAEPGEQDRRLVQAEFARQLHAPLATIADNLQLIRKGRVAVSQVLNKTLFASQRLLVMVEAALDSQQLIDGTIQPELEPASVPHLVSESITAISLLLPAGIQIDQKAERPARPILIDRTLFAKITRALLYNALHFTPPNGRIAIWTQVTPRWVVVNVADQGPPVAQEQRGLLFTSSATLTAGRRLSGVGQGLMFCKLAVEKMHGGIRVTEMPGAGAVFQFWIPLAPSQ